MSATARRLLALAVAALLLPLLVASQASATSYVFINNQVVDQQGIFGPRHTLTQITAGTNAYMLGCINALNDADGTWAGSTLCAWGTFSHAYCGCALRYPWGGDDPSEPNPNVMGATEYY